MEVGIAIEATSVISIWLPPSEEATIYGWLPSNHHMRMDSFGESDDEVNTDSCTPMAAAPSSELVCEFHPASTRRSIRPLPNHGYLEEYAADADLESLLS